MVKDADSTPVTDCRAVVTDQEKLDLLGKVQRINREFLEGRTSLVDRDKYLGSVLAGQSGKSSSWLGVAHALSQSQSAEQGQSYLQTAIQKILAGGGAAPKEREDILKAFGFPAGAGENALNFIATKLRPYRDALIGAGAVYDLQLGWDFSKTQLNANDIDKDPMIFTGLMLFLGAPAAEMLSDPHRKESVFRRRRRHQGHDLRRLE